MIVDGPTIFIAIMWSFFMFIIGAISQFFGASGKLDKIYDYILKDQDNTWIHYSCYEDLEDEKELVSRELKKEQKAHELSKSYIEDYRKQVSALETQIECLKAEVCTLKKTTQSNKKGVI